MAGLSTRSRRNTQKNPIEEVRTPEPSKDESSNTKSRYSRSSKSSNATTASSQNSGINIYITNEQQSSVEAESSTAVPSTNEDISSNTSESDSGTSNKTTSETSVTSDETLNKTKDELIKTAQDLDAQLQELIKIYKDEKRIFLEKSINMLENESHPDWLERIEELRKKRCDSLKTANERHRLKVESITAEYDFALKNISDEFQAAENEIIDEFTTKRKRKALKAQQKEFSGSNNTENAAMGTSVFNLDESQVQSDLNAINRIIAQNSNIAASDKIVQLQSS